MSGRAGQVRARGFTLLELVVVVAIFGVVSVMAYGGLNSIMNTRHNVERSLQRTADLQRAFVRVRDDFQQTRNRSVRDGFGDVQPAFRGDFTGTVSFTRGGWRNPLLAPRATLERVAYRVAEGRLVRESWRMLDRAQDTRPVSLNLLDDVEELRWRFLGAGNEWQERWADDSQGIGTAPSPLPRAVEMTVRTKDLGELRWVFRTGADLRPAAGGGS